MAGECRGPLSGPLTPRCAASRSVSGSVTRVMVVELTMVWEGEQQRKKIRLHTCSHCTDLCVLTSEKKDPY